MGKTLIDRNKEISKKRQEEVEHSFESLVGSRKRRYCNTQEQIKRTEFFEDYYLLYTRKEKQNQILEKALELLKNKENYFIFVNENAETIDVNYAIVKAKEMTKSE